METLRENEELVRLFEPCRVSDVRDGMDWLGYHHYGSVDQSIRPLFRTKAVGIARTARYLPYQGPVPNVKGDDYTKWMIDYYRDVCSDPWKNDVQKGDFIVLDVSGLHVGVIGSFSCLQCMSRGAVGFLTNGGGVRDTDEVILEKVPVWSQCIAQGMDQARIQYHEKDIPVAVGSVVIYPGDIVVADGDGVVIVPRGVAREVGRYARTIADVDRIMRQDIYKSMGWELDKSVIPVELNDETRKLMEAYAILSEDER